MDEAGTVTDSHINLLAQMQMNGIFPEIDKKLIIGMLDHRAWKSELWSTSETLRQTPQRRTKLHKVNKNPYNLKEIHEALQSNL